MAKRRIDPLTGMELVRIFASGMELSTPDLRTAVRFALEEFAERHPGRSVEIRIPLIGAVQAIEGPAHRRGTPPNVVEMDGTSWLELAIGVEPSGKVSWSGTRADLTEYFPLFTAQMLGDRP